MDTLIPVVIILAVVCFVGYKNREKLSALYDRIQKPDSVTSVPETVAPFKIEPAQPTGLVVEDQAGWTAWRDSQAPSTQAYIPEKFTPEHTASGDKVIATASNKVVPMPKSVGEGMFRYLVDLRANQLYSVRLTVSNKVPQRSIALTPSVGDKANGGASYFIKLIGAAGEIPYKSRPGGAFKQYRSLAPGDYTLEITSDKDSQVFATFK